MPDEVQFLTLWMHTSSRKTWLVLKRSAPFPMAWVIYGCPYAHANPLIPSFIVPFVNHFRHKRPSRSMFELRRNVFCNCHYYRHDFPRNINADFSLATIDLASIGPARAGFPSKCDAFIWVNGYCARALCQLHRWTVLTFHQNLDCNFVHLPTDPNAYPASSHGRPFNTIRQFCSAFNPGPGCFCGPDLQVVCVAGLGSEAVYQEWNFAKSTAACYGCRCSWGRPVVQEMVRFRLPSGERTETSK